MNPEPTYEERRADGAPGIPILLGGIIAVAASVAQIGRAHV